MFASLVGTLQLLEEEDRERIIGVIINKFRGDISLLKSGLDWFEEYSGKRVLGVIPYLPGLNIEAEDSVVLQRYSTRRDETKGLDIAVIQYPMISNFTDIDPFLPKTIARSDLSPLRASSDSLISSSCPAKKNTIEDLLF